MKPLFFLTLGFFANPYAQIQSQDWNDVSNKMDAEIITILYREAAILAESPAEEADERVRILQIQEKIARQSFDQKTILLEGELSTAAAAMEAAEKAFTDLQTDSTALSAQLDLYDRSRKRLRERLDNFPFRAVVLVKAAYSGRLEPVKEKMIYEAGRLSIKEVNGIQIISETLLKSNILVSDIIEATIEGKADCQPREWKTLENGTRRVIYLYGIFEIYPLSESIRHSSQAAQLLLPVEIHSIKSENDARLAILPANIQREIRSMLGIATQANFEVRNYLNILVRQEMQLLRSSGVTEEKAVLKNKFDALKDQLATNRLELAVMRQAYNSAWKKLEDHLNSEQRIEIVTQSDLERNRSQDVIKAELMRECLTQFRTIVKSLHSQEKSKVVNFQLVESSSRDMFRHVQLKAAKVLGTYLSPSEGDIKYTASVAFRFGFDYTSMGRDPLRRFRTKASILSKDNVKVMLSAQGFYDGMWNRNGKGVTHQYELQTILGVKVVLDHATGLIWQQDGSLNTMRLDDAENYVRKLNTERFAGFDDWRLPTLEEAMSLMAARKLDGNLYIDSLFDQRQCWIWTIDKASEFAAWVVNFRGGECVDLQVHDTLYARAVR